MADKLPWFPLYAAAFSTDGLVIPMTYEAEGIFNALLRHQWINGTVPADLRRALVKPFTPEALALVEPCFAVNRSDPSVRFNQRLEAIREEQGRKVQAAVISGRKGGLASGLARRRVASSKTERPLNDPSTYVSTSLRSSSKASTPQGTEEQHPPGKALVPIGKKEVGVRERTAGRKTKEAALNLGVEVIFRYWRDRMGFDPARTILNEKRRKRIIERLRENGADVSELLYVVDGALKDDWTMGRTGRSDRAYNGTQTIFRDREKVEELLKLVGKHPDTHPYLEADDAAPQG